MDRITYELDLYDLYDRFLEGCRVLVTIEYDGDAICKDSGCTIDNTKYVGCNVRDIPYLKSLPLDLDAIESDIIDHFTIDIMEEAIVESVSEEAYMRLFPQF
jgi:hypothetical protein